MSAGLTAVAVITSHEATSGDSTRTFELESSEAGFTLVPQLLDNGSQPLVEISPAAGKITFRVIPKLGPDQQLTVVIGSIRVAPISTTTVAGTTKVVAKLPASGLDNKPYPLRVAIDRTTSLVEADGATDFKPRVLVGGP
jgi:hypothetical protein